MVKYYVCTTVNYSALKILLQVKNFKTFLGHKQIIFFVYLGNCHHHTNTHFPTLQCLKYVKVYIKSLLTNSITFKFLYLTVSMLANLMNNNNSQ